MTTSAARQVPVLFDAKAVPGGWNRSRDGGGFSMFDQTCQPEVMARSQASAPGWLHVDEDSKGEDSHHLPGAQLRQNLSGL